MHFDNNFRYKCYRGFASHALQNQFLTDVIHEFEQKVPVGRDFWWRWWVGGEVYDVRPQGLMGLDQFSAGNEGSRSQYQQEALWQEPSSAILFSNTIQSHQPDVAEDRFIGTA